MERCYNIKPHFGFFELNICVQWCVVYPVPGFTLLHEVLPGNWWKGIGSIKHFVFVTIECCWAGFPDTPDVIMMTSSRVIIDDLISKYYAGFITCYARYHNNDVITGYFW